MALSNFRSHEIGLTGRFKFRRQNFTGLSVLQVEINIKRSRFPQSISSDDVKTLTGWRDATYEEAVRIQIDYGG
nr:hypothetical protein [Providencia sp.]